MPPQAEPPFVHKYQCIRIISWLKYYSRFSCVVQFNLLLIFLYNFAHGIGRNLRFQLCRQRTS